MATKVVRPPEYKVEVAEWGSLTWFVSAASGSSKALTVGQCVIKPGCCNPLHYHPNCDEVLHVVHGAIRHSMENGATVGMSDGDTISVPANTEHNATNIGDTDAVMFICFSAADRKTVKV